VLYASCTDAEVEDDMDPLIGCDRLLCVRVPKVPRDDVSSASFGFLFLLAAIRATASPAVEVGRYGERGGTGGGGDASRRFALTLDATEGRGVTSLGGMWCSSGLSSSSPSELGEGAAPNLNVLSSA
jgi:hypothetical protein